MASKKILSPLIVFSLILAMIAFMAFAFSIRLVYFAPFLAILFYHANFRSSLWIAAFCGLFIDMFSSTAFGVNALSYCLTTLILYRAKTLFNDKPINLSLYVILISCVFSIIMPILLFIFDKGILISAKWVITDLIVMPIIDGIYALLWFALPIFIFEKSKKLNLTKIWKKISFQKSH